MKWQDGKRNSAIWLQRPPQCWRGPEYATPNLSPLIWRLFWTESNWAMVDAEKALYSAPFCLKAGNKFPFVTVSPCPPPGRKDNSYSWKQHLCQAAQKNLTKFLSSIRFSPIYSPSHNFLPLEAQTLFPCLVTSPQIYGSLLKWYISC